MGRLLARRHGGTVSLVVVGGLPGLTHALAPDGPTPADATLTAVRAVPGVGAWTLPHIGLAYLAGPSAADRAAGAVLHDRLHERLVVPADGPADRAEVDLESLGPGTEHVVLRLASEAGAEKAVAEAAVTVLDELAVTGPTEAELVRFLERLDAQGGEIVADQGPGLSVAAVAEAARRHRAELLVLTPLAPAPLGELPVAAVHERRRPEGERVGVARPALWQKVSGLRLELLSDGVRHRPRRGEPTGLHVDDAVVLLRRPDGTRGVLDRTGGEMTIDAARWRGGQRAVAHLDELFGAVAVDDPQPLPLEEDLRRFAASPRAGFLTVMALLVTAVFALFVGTGIFFEAGQAGFAVVSGLLGVVLVGGLWTLAVSWLRSQRAAKAAVRARTG